MSKVLKVIRVYYQKIERITLEVVVTARKLKPYFQGHQKLVKIDYPICQVLKKSNLTDRMES